MSKSQITSQLTRVTVPSISDGKFADGIKSAFETINNNFKNIASLPFIQGVQGDSYTLISKDIWVENGTYNYKLSKEGAVLLNSIFESHLKNTGIKFNEGDSFEKCKKEKLGDLYLNGISPLDSFFTEEIEEGKTVKKLINNKLYFYSIINNLNEEQDTYLGQYFYFIDARITELGSVYSTGGLSEFNDFTGFYQYQPANDTEPERYNVISIVPNLYYDKYKDDICWKYNGQETGISAIGPKGLDGKDSSFLIIFVSNTSETANSGNILGYYDFNENGGKGGIIYTGTTDTIKDCFCLIQFVSTTVENGKTEITEYIDSAFGEVHTNKAYWEDEYRISKLFNNQNITRYFCSMGDPSSIENNPSYFAIPSDRDRSNSSKTTYQYGHVLLSSEEGDLVLQKSTNAFTANGQQEEALELYTIKESNFNIRNYNVNIGDSDIGVGGNLTVVGSASIGSLEVTGGVTVTGDTNFNVHLNTGTVSLKSGNDYGISCDDYGTMNIKADDLTIEGGVSMTDSLSVTGGATINNELNVTGGLQATTKKPNIVDMTGGTPDTTDGKSNVLFGHNNPGNSGLPDFPLAIEKAGYPLVIKSTTSTGTTDPGYMVFGPADIYAVKKGIVNSKDAIIPNTLCLQHRNKYFGDVQIGRNLKIGDYTETKEDDGTGGNLIIREPFDTDGNVNKALVIKKSDENPADYRINKDKLTIFSNGNIVTEGSATIGSTLLVTGSCKISYDLSVGKQLLVNNGGTNPSRVSHIWGYNAYGDTSYGGTGLIVEGGSGGETGATYQGNGGVGLVVKGGTAGYFTGATGDAGSGGTGLVVYGGDPGEAGGHSTNKYGNAIQTYGNIIIGDTGGTYPTKISSNYLGLSIDRKTIMSNGTTIYKGATINSGAIINNGDLEVNGEVNGKPAGINVTNGYIRGCNIYNLASAWSGNLGNQSIEKFDDNTGSYQTNLRVLGRSSENGDLYINNYYVIDAVGAYVFPKEFPENTVINLFVPYGIDESVDIIRNVKINGSKKSPVGHSNLMNQGSHATVILGENIKTITYYHSASESTKELEIRIPQYIFYTNSKHIYDDNFD